MRRVTEIGMMIAGAPEECHDRWLQQFQHCSTWVFGSKCCEISPVATLSPLLRNPTLLQTHSCPIQAFIRIPIAATRTGGSIETWAAASWGCEGNVHTRQGLPHGCVAATGRATSVGLRNCSAASRKNARVDCETVCDGLATPRARSARRLAK